MFNDHYGLSGRPFQLTPDPRFYFDSATHRKAMAYLGYGLAQGEGFIVVTGEIGSGKTTLVGHLMANIDPLLVNAVKIVSTQVEGDDILRLAASALGLPVDAASKGQLLDRIERLITDRARSGQRTLLIVDEAQNLGTSALEELRMLSNYQAADRAMLQIFLLGQPEFRDRLAASDSLEQLRQRVIATHHLTAMTADEIEPYILHRLKLVGWVGTPRFTPDVFGQVYDHTGGMPRRINNLMTRVMLMGAMDKLGVIDGAMVRAVVADQLAEHGAPLAAASASTGSPVEPAAANVPSPGALDVAARLAMLEAKSDEQDAALRRLLTLLIDWAEAPAPAQSATSPLRAPAY